MKILKFGGTSVGSAEAMKIVKTIVTSTQGQTVVVVSALGGVTDRLLKIGWMAESGNQECFEQLDLVVGQHLELIGKLFEKEETIEVNQLVAKDFKDLESLVRAVYSLGELSQKSASRLLGTGELLSSKIVSRYLRAKWFDSRLFIKTNSGQTRPMVLMEETISNLRSIKEELGQLSLFPGFVSSNENNENSILGRGGSDYTASILAVALNAEILQIWTDVDGFMTADPKRVSQAHGIDQLSYQEALELSHFGAKVIYPPTITPVHAAQIPVLIKNTFNPNGSGTLINSQRVDIKKRQIKGISSISGISLLTLNGIGMVGVTGISKRFFSALANEDINIILISQASSENSITVAIETTYCQTACKAIELEFVREMESRQVNPVRIDQDLAIVAIVGENMKHTPGISGHLFHSIGANGINVYSIAQGASELNISFVVDEKFLKKTLTVIHEAFFLSDFTRLNIFLVGKGTVGGNLLTKLAKQAEKLMESNKLHLRLVGLAGSKSFLVNEKGLDPKEAMQRLETDGFDGTINDFVAHAIDMNLPNSVFVDCTASHKVASFYHELLENNVSVVTANKIAGSSKFATYQKLKETALKKGVRFYYETNVGAGLPIIAPINDLVKSGDKIIRLEAVLSGTLNFISNNLAEAAPLSTVIAKAKFMGYSEPDPRIDLSGQDVARKILILARESGYALEHEDIKVEPFVPKKYLETTSYDEFIDLVTKELDGVFEERRKRIASENKRLRYAAQLLNGDVKVGIMEVDSYHPFYDLEGSNNVVLIWSDNYSEHPLVIKGYGAGADVTAIGVLADIIKVANK